MFKKVLIAEDEEFMNIALRMALEDLGVVQDNRDYVVNCDYAYSRVKKAISEAHPYQLLIADLSFKGDTEKREISSGWELIQAVKEIQPAIKVMVFSADDRKNIADRLFKDYQIDAYVHKSFGAVNAFKTAIKTVNDGRKYCSANLRRFPGDEILAELTGEEKLILKLTTEGVKQKSIAACFKKKGMSSSSLSHIEKKLKALREKLNISSTFLLAWHCRERGIV
ncbi:response regulator [uncultured Pedobacter sp.]|uniref:response regulator n=1 Tax=uncultured Pedobacter sp. TaxID=246139 RepID=UPI0025DAB2EE|nr:response regulator [uncultured Pedobacter sp.]